MRPSPAADRIGRVWPPERVSARRAVRSAIKNPVDAKHQRGGGEKDVWVCNPVLGADPLRSSVFEVFWDGAALKQSELGENGLGTVAPGTEEQEQVAGGDEPVTVEVGWPSG